MAKLPAGISSGLKEKDGARDFTEESSVSSRKSAKKKPSKEPKPTKISEEDLIDIFNSDLNRLKERFGTVTLANTSTGKACIVLPVEVGWCMRCNNIMLRNDSNLCERHKIGEDRSVGTGH